MNRKYKVEIREVTTYCVDVLAESETDAHVKAMNIWDERCKEGTYHYLETGAETEMGNTYDVTDTDDPFNP